MASITFELLKKKKKKKKIRRINRSQTTLSSLTASSSSISAVPFVNNSVNPKDRERERGKESLQARPHNTALRYHPIYTLSFSSSHPSVSRTHPFAKGIAIEGSRRRKMEGDP